MHFCASWTPNSRFLVPREVKEVQILRDFQHSCALRTFLLKIKYFVLHEPQTYQMSSIYVLRQPHISNIFLLSGTPILWLRENGTICPFGVYPCVEAIFWPNWGQTLWWGRLWSCLFFPCFVGISAVYGSCPNSPLSFSTPIKHVLKGKCPILTRKITTKLGKN